MKSDFWIQVQASPPATRVTAGMLLNLPIPQYQYQQNEDGLSPYLLRMLEGVMMLKALTNAWHRVATQEAEQSLLLSL